MYSYTRVTVSDIRDTNPKSNKTDNSKKEESMPNTDEFESTTDFESTEEVNSAEETAKPDAPLNDTSVQELQDAIADNQRLMAEYSNYRKRVEREKVTAGHNATFKAIQAVVPVLDDIELAMKHDSDNIPEPIQRIFEKLISALEGVGLDIVNESNVPFDPAIHEGILYQEVEGIEAEHVAETVRTGYRMNTDNRVIRGAQVIIAK